MTDWTETHRGAVPPWQCAVTEHFTVAYYCDPLEDADARLYVRVVRGPLGDEALRYLARPVAPGWSAFREARRNAG